MINMVKFSRKNELEEYFFMNNNLYKTKKIIISAFCLLLTLIMWRCEIMLFGGTVRLTFGETFYRFASIILGPFYGAVIACLSEMHGTIAAILIQMGILGIYIFVFCLLAAAKGMGEPFVSLILSSPIVGIVVGFVSLILFFSTAGIVDDFVRWILSLILSVQIIGIVGFIDGFLVGFLYRYLDRFSWFKRRILRLIASIFCSNIVCDFITFLSKLFILRMLPDVITDLIGYLFILRILPDVTTNLIGNLFMVFINAIILLIMLKIYDKIVEKN